jgi:hypothetical protein
MRVPVVNQNRRAWRCVAGLLRATGVALLHVAQAGLLVSLVTASPNIAQAQNRSTETLTDALVQTYRDNPVFNA